MEADFRTPYFVNRAGDDHKILAGVKTPGAQKNPGRREHRNEKKQGDNTNYHSKIIRLKETKSKVAVDNGEQGKTDHFGKMLEYDDRLFISINASSRFIKVSNILCITAEKDYTFVNMTDGKKILVLRPMIEWEERLPWKYFARIHRSTIVNLDHVEKVEKWFNYAYHVFLKGMDEPFQMSRRYAVKIKERFR